jgi:hypothetical protein
MAFVVKQDESPNPVYVPFLGAERHVSHPDSDPHLVQQFRFVTDSARALGLTRLSDHHFHLRFWNGFQFPSTKMQVTVVHFLVEGCS